MKPDPRRPVQIHPNDPQVTIELDPIDGVERSVNARLSRANGLVSGVAYSFKTGEYETVIALSFEAIQAAYCSAILVSAQEKDA